MPAFRDANFCNFYKPVSNEACYITSLGEYVQKIDEMHELGGTSSLLQGRDASPSWN